MIWKKQNGDTMLVATLQLKANQKFNMQIICVWMQSANDKWEHSEDNVLKYIHQNKWFT